MLNELNTKVGISISMCTSAHFRLIAKGWPNIYTFSTPTRLGYDITKHFHVFTCALLEKKRRTRRCRVRDRHSRVQPQQLILAACTLHADRVETHRPVVGVLQAVHMYIRREKEREKMEKILEDQNRRERQNEQRRTNERINE